VSDLGRSPASYRGLVAHWRQHATSTQIVIFQTCPANPGHSELLTKPPRQQSLTVADHGIRARTGFGISRSRDGSGQKLRSFSESRSAPRKSSTPAR
jgi:hypothetical protein